MEELAAVHAAELAAALDEEDDETESDSESDHDAVLPDSDSVPNEMPSPIVLKKKAVVAHAKGPWKGTKGKKVSARAAAKRVPKKPDPAPATHISSAHSHTLGKNHGGMRGSVPCAARTIKPAALDSTGSTWKSPPKLLTKPPS